MHYHSESSQDAYVFAWILFPTPENTSAVAKIREQRTATYCAVITKTGELSLGLGDMDIHQQITTQYVSMPVMAVKGRSETALLRTFHFQVCSALSVMFLCLYWNQFFLKGQKPILDSAWWNSSTFHFEQALVSLYLLLWTVYWEISVQKPSDNSV